MLNSHQVLTLLATALGSGVGVSLLVAAGKKFGFVKSLAHELVMATSLIAGAAQYVIQFHSNLPTSVLGVSTLSVYGFSQLVYKNSSRLNSFLGKVYGGNSQPASQTTASETPAASESAATSEQPAANAEGNVLAV